MPDTPPRRQQPDDLPRHAASDPPLSLDARTPGPRGLSPKLAWAALGLLVLAAMVAAMWAGAHASPKGQMEKPPSRIEQHV